MKDKNLFNSWAFNNCVCWSSFGCVCECLDVCLWLYVCVCSDVFACACLKVFGRLNFFLKLFGLNLAYMTKVCMPKAFASKQKVTQTITKLTILFAIISIL